MIAKREILQPMERLLLWRLALAGGAGLKDLKPTPDTKHRTALKAAGLISEGKQKPEQGGPAATFLELTDASGLLSGILLDDAWQHGNAEVAAHFLDRYRDLLGGT